MCGSGLREWLKRLDSPEWTHIADSISSSEPLPLASVFVDVYAVPESHVSADADPTYGRVRRLAGRITSDTHEIIDASSMLARTGSLCIVVGDPGSGKSTLTKWLAQHVNGGHSPDYELPLVVPLGSYGLSNSVFGGLSLLEYFLESCGVEHDLHSAAMCLRRAGREMRRTLMILDGWDEVPPAHRLAVHRRIMAELDFFTIIVTSRPSGLPRKLFADGGAELFHLAGLGKSGRGALVERRLQARGRGHLAPDILGRIESSDDLKEVACNPFMLGLVTEAMAIDGSHDRPEWSLSTLYEIATDWIVESSEERGLDVPAELSQSLPGLKALSFALLFQEALGRYTFTPGDLRTHLSRRGADAVCRSRFVGRLGLLSDRWAFTHATLQEYFAACQFGALSPSAVSSACQRAFASLSRNIVLEFAVGLESPAGAACRAELERLSKQQDRYGQLVLRAARMVASFPRRLRPPAMKSELGETLWRMVTGDGDMDAKARAIAAFARLDPVALCRTARAAKTSDQYVLDCIVSSVPRGIAQGQQLSDLIDPAMRERLDAELLEPSPPHALALNRAVIADPSADLDTLRGAVLYAGASRDGLAVSALVSCLSRPKLTEQIHQEVITSLGLIGGDAAARALVEVVIGAFKLARVPTGLARRSLQHIEGGHRRLNPQGRDALMRRLAATAVDRPHAIMMLSSLNGMPVRTGLELLLHWYRSKSAPSFFRFECLQVIERSLPDQGLDALLEEIEELPTDFQTLLVGWAIRRRRPVPIGWLRSRLAGATRLPDKAMLLTIALTMSERAAGSASEVDLLLAGTASTALTDDDPRHHDLATALRRSLLDSPPPAQASSTWIDGELAKRVLDGFVDRKEDILSERVMLAGALLGRLTDPEANRTLRRGVEACRRRLSETTLPAQLSLLKEVAAALASALANLDPEALLSFPSDWEPAADCLRSLSNSRGWLVFDDRILDEEGERIQSPFSCSASGAGGSPVTGDEAEPAAPDTRTPRISTSPTAEPGPPKLDDQELEVLLFVSETPRRARLRNIAAAIHKTVSRAGDICRDLEGMGLLHRPQGQRSGYSLTPAARSLLSQRDIQHRNSTGTTP